MSEKDKQEPTNVLKDIKKPLLDGHSPQASEQGNDDDINIPAHKVAEDSRPVSTGNFTNAAKTETQAQLDSFLIYFGESAAHNERKDGDYGRPVDEESELSDSIQHFGSQKTTKEQLLQKLVKFDAPDDATKCVRIESL